MSDQIASAQPTAGTLVDTMFDAPDYRDAFVVEPGPLGFGSVAEVAASYFLNQPRWLSLVSMNLSSRERLVAAIGDRTFATGSSVGSWKIYDRSVDEIVFGDDMGFMEYRFSFWLRPDGRLEASTAVKYRWKRMSHLYFTLVKPMHKRFVPVSLRALRVAEVPVAA